MSAASQDTPLRVEVIQFPAQADRWDLVRKYMQLRRSVFITQMDWTLHSHEGQEFEQYDTFSATYVIATLGSEVVGGARLLRADNRNGIYRYMIRDACDGLLEGMPDNLCAEETPPTGDNAWELTRLVSARGARVAAEVLKRCNFFLRTQKAEVCLFLGPPSFLRMAKRMGYAPRPLGPVVSNKDGSFLAFQCPVM